MTSTVFVVLIGAVGMLATLFIRPLYDLIALDPVRMLSGEVWRLVTWPLAESFGLFGIINIALLWLFGRDLESQVGKRQMAMLFFGIWASLTLTNVIFGLLFGGGIAGLQMVEFCLLLIWIAQWPTRRFFFNIPAWVFGIVLLALQVLPMLALGAFGQLIGFIAALLFVGMAARSVGLLEAYSWLPGRRRRRSHRPAGAKPSRSHEKARQRKATDEERIDQLLDKINAEGIHSLTRSERAELEKLRQRRR